MSCLHCCFFLLFLENGSGGRIPSNFDCGLRMAFSGFIVILGPSIKKTFQTCTGTKNTKPLDAPNLHRHQKKTKPQQLVRKHGHRFGIFGMFVFFGASAGLVHLVVWFFCFFWCLCTFGEPSHSKHWYLQCFVSLIITSTSKICFSPGFQSTQAQKTLVFTVFCDYLE